MFFSWLKFMYVGHCSHNTKQTDFSDSLSWTVRMLAKLFLWGLTFAALTIRRANGDETGLTMGPTSQPCTKTAKSRKKSMPGFNRIWRVEHVTQRPGTHPCSNATVCRCCLLKANVVSLALSAMSPAMRCRELQPYRQFNLTDASTRLLYFLNFLLLMALVF